MKLLNICNKIIEYSFYLLFFLVPLALTGDTSELFEFNKLWVTFILTIVIGSAWITKMIVKKEFKIQRTPLDIPIALFLVSQILSTIFSMDPHVSLWGYYSRFNGGLFSILSYVFLYYAFVSNYKDLNKEEEEKELSLTRILIYIGGFAIFLGGVIIASQLNSLASSSFIPFQMLILLVTAIASLAVFMKVSPSGLLKKSFYALLTSAVIVVLWGLPSRFGYDPTCLLFRGTLDVSCWTADFQPKIRVFSTMGQPDWLAVYLVALIPLSMGILLNFVTGKKLLTKGRNLTNYNLFFSIGLFVFIAVSYLMLSYTLSRSAILAMWMCFAIFFGYFFWIFVKPKFNKTKINLDFKFALALVIIIAAITFVRGSPFPFLNNFTLSAVTSYFTTQIKPSDKNSAPAKVAVTPTPAPKSAGELGGTDSGVIRKYVWEGAINIWKHYPVLGSGLETYAFSYYQYRPQGHNLTSEWNFLYNKAHNEYLNYLATTGTLGIATYLFMIGSFLFISFKFLFKNIKNPSKTDLLIASLVIGYGGILISNFFGFSVVMVNILFYLIPAFVLIEAGLINFDKHFGFSLSNNKKGIYVLSNPQKGLISASLLIGLYLIFVLSRFWIADRYYYLGFNYDRTGDYQKAYQYLQQAVNIRPSEPVFRDELSLNNAILASSLLYQNQTKADEKNLKLAKQLVDNAITLSNKLIADDPNNIVTWKTRVRVLYTLSQVDQSYLPLTLEAIKQAQTLAPTDADVSYNLGVLYGQTGNLKKGVEVLENTIKLKPNYSNAYYALGIFYHQLSLDDKGKIVNPEYAKKAIDKMEYIIKTFGPNQQAQDAINTWTGVTKN